MTTCREWTQPDGNHFHGLCTNEFWPKAGTRGCNICVDPVFSLRTGGICSCLATENSLVRSLDVSIAVGPTPSGFYGFLSPSVVGDYALRTVLESATGEAIYDVNTDSFLPNPTTPIISCSLSAPIKMHEEGPFPPGVWSIQVVASGSGTGVFNGQKSWNAMIISIIIRRWKQMTADPLESRYIVDSAFPVGQWNFAAIGPHPRCESNFHSAVGQALWIGGSSGAEPGNWVVTVTGGK